MSDQGISEEELEKLLMESGLGADDEESLVMDTPATEASIPSFEQTQEQNSTPEGEKTMSQSEIDALLASLSASDDD